MNELNCLMLFGSIFFSSFSVGTTATIHYTMIAQFLWYYLFESQIKQAHSMIWCTRNRRLVQPFELLSELHQPIGPKTWSQMCKISAARLLDSPNRSDRCRTFPKILIAVVLCRNDIHSCWRQRISKLMIIILLCVALAKEMEIIEMSLTSIDKGFPRGNSYSLFRGKRDLRPPHTKLLLHFPLYNRTVAVSSDQWSPFRDLGISIVRHATGYNPLRPNQPQFHTNQTIEWEWLLPNYISLWTPLPNVLFNIIWFCTNTHLPFGSMNFHCRFEQKF